MDSAMSMLRIAKPIVNILITNAETQYLGAEPGELESSPNMCSQICVWTELLVSSLVDPASGIQGICILFSTLCCALDILSQVAQEDCGWGRSLNFESFKSQLLPWILLSCSILAIGVCWETTQLSAVTLLNFPSSRQMGVMGRSTHCLELPLCEMWARFANEPNLSGFGAENWEDKSFSQERLIAWVTGTIQAVTESN